MKYLHNQGQKRKNSVLVITISSIDPAWSVRLARKAHKDRESKKFWKRWLYIPPTKEEEEAVSRVSWWLKNALSAGRDDLAQLREYRTYHEKPDHWMDMTTKQLMERRLSRAKKALDLN